MKQYSKELLKSYNDQVKNIFTSGAVSERPEDFVVQKAIPGLAGDAQLLYVEGGLFTECGLERPVLNIVSNPQRSLGNFIPVIRRNTQVSKYAFLTDITEPTGDLPDFPCDDPQQVGNLAAAFMSVRKGRASLGSKTLELDTIIQKYHEGITTDLYLVGDVRGVSAVIPGGMQDNLAIMAEMAVNRQFQLIARGLQRMLLKQFWTGDPTNLALNTGGARQFWGMDFLIADDYASKTWITGTGDAKLNSDIKDFDDTCVGAAEAVTGQGLYEFMQTLAANLDMRANYYGYTNVETVIVMRPEMWQSIVSWLPCEMLQGCGRPVFDGSTTSLGTQVQVTASGSELAAIRERMQRSQRITLNAKEYKVILDDAIPAVRAAGPPASATSSIYFVTLNVDGQPTVFWDSADYRAVSRALQPVGTGMIGYTDGGLFLSVVDQLRFCFAVTTKCEVGLVNLAPFLCGRIDNVASCTIQAMPFATGF